MSPVFNAPLTHSQSCYESVSELWRHAPEAHVYPELFSSRPVCFFALAIEREKREGELEVWANPLISNKRHTFLRVPVFKSASGHRGQILFCMLPRDAATICESYKSGCRCLLARPTNPGYAFSCPYNHDNPPLVVVWSEKTLTSQDKIRPDRPDIKIRTQRRTEYLQIYHIAPPKWSSFVYRCMRITRRSRISIGSRRTRL